MTRTGLRSRLVGHLYVVRFADGLVKVGCGTAWEPRVHRHVGEGARHGNLWKSMWTSTVMPGMAAAERELIGWCERQAGAEKLGREWFHGLSIIEVIRRVEIITAQRRADTGAPDADHVGTYTFALGPERTLRTAERYRTPADTGLSRTEPRGGRPCDDPFSLVVRTVSTSSRD